MRSTEKAVIHAHAGIQFVGLIALNLFPSFALAVVTASLTRGVGRLTTTLALSVMAILGLAISSACAQSPATYSYELVRAHPHDPGAFTQGLAHAGGKLYESTGLHGKSTLREVELATGAVKRMNRLHPRIFAEGLTVLGERIFQITWKSHLGLVFDKNSLELLHTFHYPTEGWGLTNDGHHLIMSDGTDTLYFLDPDDFHEIRRIQVSDEGQAISQLNELEFIRGEIYANVWKSTRIARISPETGRVNAWIDLTPLNERENPLEKEREQRNVLNGIAHDQENDRLFVTGKRWAHVYEIRLVPTR